MSPVRAKSWLLGHFGTPQYVKLGVLGILITRILSLSSKDVCAPAYPSLEDRKVGKCVSLQSQQGGVLSLCTFLCYFILFFTASKIDREYRKIS